jgi:cytochrome c2/cytochrome b561
MRDAYGRNSHWLGWAITASYLFHQFITTRLPRTDKSLSLREELRGWHYLIGAILLVLVIARLVTWYREGWVKPPPGLPATAWNWGRALALGSYLLLLAAPLLGLLFAWSDGLPVHFGPAPALPQAIEESRSLWMFTGYFHSGMGFMLILLNLTALLSAAYLLLRYGYGLLAAFPPGYGAFAFVGLSASVYALTTFSSPDPGIPALLIFWSLIGAVWLVGRFLRSRRLAAAAAGRDVPQRAVTPPSPAFRAVAAAVVLAVIGFGAYGPYALFRVTPWPTTKAIASPEGASWHAAPVAKVAVTPETPFERQIRAETFKWCTFCHTTKKGQEHIVGPNLYAIFGQRAGSAPGFAYSEAMLEARDKGLVWNEETIAAYIADPDKFMPGTTMIISSGPIRDEKRRRAVVNILKRETMGDAAKQ